MSRPEHFRIRWLVPETEWIKACEVMAKEGRGSDYDREGLGRFYLLYGNVDFVLDEVSFYVGIYEDGVNISVLDLAVWFADAVLARRFEPGAVTAYEELDDALVIHFAATEQEVVMDASDRAGTLSIPRDAFERGVRDFLVAFATAIESRFEGALDWDTLAPLRASLRAAEPHARGATGNTNDP